MNNSLKPETLCVQGGWQPKKGEPRVLPIYQSTTFKYDTSEQMAKLFDLEESGYFYTRLRHLPKRRSWLRQHRLSGFVDGYRNNHSLPDRTVSPSVRWSHT